MKSFIISLFAIISLLIPTLADAAKIEAKRGVVKESYNFWFCEPELNTDEAKPVVIFLHGASLCGNDLNRVKRYGTIAAIEKGRSIDAYVVAPQNPGGAWSPSKIMKVVDWVKENKNVDSKRIYVLGMSLGGYGAIDLAAAYPDDIAAAMAFCGGGTSKKIEDLNKVPLWIVHGTADRAVSVKESDKVVNKMKNADPKTPRLIYDRVPGMNHSQPARFFYLDDSYEWLLSHSLDDPGRPVSARFDITGAARYAYAGLNHSRSTYTAKSSASKSSKKYSSKRSSKKRSSAKARTKARSKSRAKAKR